MLAAQLERTKASFAFCMPSRITGDIFNLFTTRGRPKRTWKEVVQENCQARKLNKEDAMDSLQMEKDDKGSTLIRIGVSG